MSQSDGDEKRFRESERRITSQSGYTLSYDGFPDSENTKYRLWRDGKREPFLTFKSISEAGIYARDVLKLTVLAEQKPSVVAAVLSRKGGTPSETSCEGSVESAACTTLESMANKGLRLSQETQGTVAEGGHRTIVMLHEGSEIALVGQVAEHPEMVEVSWNGQSVWVFAIDFEERTKDEVSDEASKAASELSTSIEVKMPATTQPAGTPRVRRFNSAGRELF